MYILSQVLVGISDVFCVMSMLSKQKKNIVILLVLSTLLFSLHYICLGGWTGAGIGGIEIIFLLLMYLLEIKDKTKYNVYLSVATIIITVIVSIITWSSWISVLPMIGMVVYLFLMMFKNVMIVKSGALVRFAFNGTYMILLKSYVGAGLSLVILGFTIYGIVKDYKERKQNSDIKEKEHISTEKVTDDVNVQEEYANKNDK